MPKYQVVERKTGRVLGTYLSLETARRKADRFDLEYGAIASFTRPIETLGECKPVVLGAGSVLKGL
jgi:hypothetical protein